MNKPPRDGAPVDGDLLQAENLRLDGACLQVVAHVDPLLCEDEGRCGINDLEPHERDHRLAAVSWWLRTSASAGDPRGIQPDLTRVRTQVGSHR